MKMNYTTALACATLLLPTIATATPHKSHVAPGDVDDAANRDAHGIDLKPEYETR